MTRIQKADLKRRRKNAKRLSDKFSEQLAHTKIEVVEKKDASPTARV